MSFGILGSYMDINDYENPIKSFFDDTNIYYIDPDFTKEIQIYLKLSEANMDDDYLGVSSQITKQFLDVERVREDLQSPASDSAVTVVYQTVKFNIKFLIIFIKPKIIYLNNILCYLLFLFEIKLIKSIENVLNLNMMLQLKIIFRKLLL